MPLRFLPEHALPPYAHVPGRTPHPVSDPAGHSFGQRHEALPAIDPRRWRESRAYLRGLDLFNHGYFWEAHEEWEGLWHAAGRKGTVADFLKGLIQLAVAGVKEREGKPDGLRTHARRAAELWRSCPDDLLLGLRPAELVLLAEHAAAVGSLAGVALTPTEIG